MGPSRRKRTPGGGLGRTPGNEAFESDRVELLDFLESSTYIRSVMFELIRVPGFDPVLDGAVARRSCR